MKIPVFCSLLPVELISSLGFEPYFLSADELVKNGSREYHCSFHDNLCSYAKVLYDYFLANHEQFAIIVIPSACDAQKKLYNALRGHLKDKVYLLDIPHIKGEAAIGFLTEEFRKLVLRLEKIENGSLCEREDALVASPKKSNKTKIGIIGANVPLDVFEKSANNFEIDLVYLNHCLIKVMQNYSLFNSEGSFVLEQNNDLQKYARHFLDNNTCPRTLDDGYKDDLLKEIKTQNLAGLIVNSLKFCDFQPFDYKYLKKRIDKPILTIEHELTSNSEGQTMTRLEAFFEKIKGEKRPHAKVTRKGSFYIGIDSGSHATKMVCIDKDQKIVGRAVLKTGTSVKESAEMVMSKFKKENNINDADIVRVVATGYGRNKIKCADDVITEITCHALGANFLLKTMATIIDIGGQDSKAIKIDANGAVIQFAMNDKCAAGTGRFLEVMASKLEMSLEEFAELSYSAKNHVPISSMCSVFAESEVISLIASGKSKEEISKGIHRAIAERTLGLAKRIDGIPPYFITGGVAKNKGLVKEIEACLGHKLQVLEDPQFSGALGAAIIATK